MWVHIEMKKEVDQLRSQLGQGLFSLVFTAFHFGLVSVRYGCTEGFFFHN